MKRGLVLLLLFCLLVSPIVFADEVATVSSKDIVVAQTKEELSALRGGLDNKTEDLLAREVNVPPYLEVPLKVLFGMGEERTYNELIILFSIWIVMFGIIYVVLEFTPIFKGGAVSFLSALIIMFIVSITGIIDKVSLFFWDILDSLEFLGSSKIPAVVVVVIIILFILSVISGAIKKKLLLTKAEMSGQNIHTLNEMGKIQGEALEEMSKEERNYERYE